MESLFFFCSFDFYVSFQFVTVIVLCGGRSHIQSLLRPIECVSLLCWSYFYIVCFFLFQLVFLSLFNFWPDIANKWTNVCGGGRARAFVCLRIRETNNTYYTSNISSCGEDKIKSTPKRFTAEHSVGIESRLWKLLRVLGVRNVRVLRG